MSGWEQELFYWLIVTMTMIFIAFWLIVSFLLWKKTNYLSRILCQGTGRVLVKLSVVNFMINVFFLVMAILVVIRR